MIDNHEPRIPIDGSATEELAEARRAVLEGTPDGYRTVGEPEPGLFPADMPPIMVIENYRMHPSIERFTALIRYVGLPDPIAIVVGSVNTDKKTPRDVYGVITFPGMPETFGCKVLLDDEDAPMCILHASDCIRSRIIRESLISQKQPSSMGPCHLDDLVSSNDPEKLARIPVATAPAFDDGVQEDAAAITAEIEKLAGMLEGLDDADPETLMKIIGELRGKSPETLTEAIEKLRGKDLDATDGGTD